MNREDIKAILDNQVETWAEARSVDYFTKEDMLIAASLDILATNNIMDREAEFTDDVDIADVVMMHSDALMRAQEYINRKKFSR